MRLRLLATQDELKNSVLKVLGYKVEMRWCGPGNCKERIVSSSTKLLELPIHIPEVDDYQRLIVVIEKE